MVCCVVYTSGLSDAGSLQVIHMHMPTLDQCLFSIAHTCPSCKMHTKVSTKQRQVQNTVTAVGLQLPIFCIPQNSAFFSHYWAR